MAPEPVADEKEQAEASLDVALARRTTEETRAADEQQALEPLVCDTHRLVLPRIQASPAAEAVVAPVAADSHQLQGIPDRKVAVAERLELGTSLAEKAELVAARRLLNACSGRSISQAALVEACSQPFPCEAE